MGRALTQPIRFRDQRLMSWRVTEKGAGPTQTDSKSVRRINLRNQMSQNQCQWVRVKTTKEG